MSQAEMKMTRELLLLLLYFSSVRCCEKLLLSFAMQEMEVTVKLASRWNRLECRERKVIILLILGGEMVSLSLPKVS